MKSFFRKYSFMFIVTFITFIFTGALFINAEEKINNIEKISTNIIKSRDKYLEVDVKIPIFESENLKPIGNKISVWTLGWVNEIKNVSRECRKNNCTIAYPFVANLDYKVTENNGKILSLYLDYHQFTGGAHGMSNRRAYNINRNNGKLILLGEYFNENYDYKTLINNEIKSEINKEKNFYFDDGKVFKGINEKTLYYLTDDSLVIYFNTYEIAPYSSGIREFKIPLSKFDNNFSYDNIK